MKPVQKSPRVLNRLKDSFLFQFLCWPLVLLFLVFLVQIRFMVFPCDSGFAIGGCALGVMGIFAFVVYEIVLYLLVASVVLGILKFLNKGHLKLEVMMLLGIISSILGVIGLILTVTSEPFSFLLKQVIMLFF